VTGQLCNYGNNSYGSKPATTHYFYSNLYPPSTKAYPSEGQNRSLQVTELPAGKTLADVLPTLSKQSFSSNFANAAPTCGSVAGQTLVYAWNDMGGPSDDLDYNDAAYTFSCSGAGNGSGSSATGVVLIK
jgi:hypothetical protein